MHTINFIDLFYLILPISFVFYIYFKYTNDKTTIPYAISRMFLQLIFIGYILTYIFNSKDFVYIILILTFMLIVASIISLRPLENKNNFLYFYSFISILIGGGITLFIVVVFILKINTWYEPRYIIPLAGMIFANSMNSLSLGAERFQSQYKLKKSYISSRNEAYKTALISNINSLFAVGLVSIPGMMTGQILSGVDIIITVKYQIMVMLMILSSSGISVFVYLKLLKKGYI